jgi:hypothetical protein
MGMRYRTKTICAPTKKAPRPTAVRTATGMGATTVRMGVSPCQGPKTMTAARYLPVVVLQFQPPHHFLLVEMTEVGLAIA